MVSPETSCSSRRPMQIYTRILRENADFKDGDKVTFYLAHRRAREGEFRRHAQDAGGI